MCGRYQLLIQLSKVPIQLQKSNRQKCNILAAAVVQNFVALQIEVQLLFFHLKYINMQDKNCSNKCLQNVYSFNYNYILVRSQIPVMYCLTFTNILSNNPFVESKCFFRSHMRNSNTKYNFASS